MDAEPASQPDAMTTPAPQGEPQPTQAPLIILDTSPPPSVRNVQPDNVEIPHSGAYAKLPNLKDSGDIVDSDVAMSVGPSASQVGTEYSK